jgi:dephospho-CoA kinase
VTRIVALTGGIGSGKSTVGALLAKLGAAVIDADAIVHELQARGSPVLDEMVAAFGPEILDESGALDRKALGDAVFRDPEARRRLEAIVHPRVGAEFARRLEAAKDSGVPLVVLDIPLYFETRQEGGGGASRMPVDAVLLAYAPEEVQLERTVLRDGCSRDEALRRIRAQLPIEEKKRLADVVIDNSGSLAETERQARAFYEQMVSDAA